MVSVPSGFLRNPCLELLTNFFKRIQIEIDQVLARLSYERILLDVEEPRHPFIRRRLCQ